MLCFNNGRIALIKVKTIDEAFMEQKSILENLSDKVTLVLQKYDELKSENETLRSELMTLRSQSGGKDEELERLREENAMKDLEIEEIVNKIEGILS